MAFKILVAKTTELLDKAFKLRHQVFVEEEGLLKATPDGRLVDRFDAYPTTSILVVTTEQQVVGTFRLALDSSEGLPADEYYDFRKHVPENSRLMHTSLLCISKAHRSLKLTTGLALMAGYFAESHHITHIVAPINPAIAKWLQRIGYRAVGEVFLEPHTGAPMLPLVHDMRDTNDFFLNFIKENQLYDFLQDYERWFYQPGETVIQSGTIGEEAFLIIEGTVQVRVTGTEQVIEELHEGDIFGELALLTDAPRSADVVAVTHVIVMVLSKTIFLSRFINHPEHALKLMSILGRRTQALIHQLEHYCYGNSIQS